MILTTDRHVQQLQMSHFRCLPLYHCIQLILTSHQSGLKVVGNIIFLEKIITYLLDHPFPDWLK